MKKVIKRIDRREQKSKRLENLVTDRLKYPKK